MHTQRYQQTMQQETHTTVELILENDRVIESATNTNIHIGTKGNMLKRKSNRIEPNGIE